MKQQKPGVWPDCKHTKVVLHSKIWRSQRRSNDTVEKAVLHSSLSLVVVYLSRGNMKRIGASGPKWWSLIFSAIIIPAATHTRVWGF